LEKAGGPTHRWYVFEAKAHRVQKSLSDLNGTEIYIHRGKPIGVFQQLANALTRATNRPTVPELQAIYRDLKKAADRIKRELRTKSVFESRAYDDLVLAANASARKRIASLRQSG
jgi:DNA polymerase III delta subunit